LSANAVPARNAGSFMPHSGAVTERICREHDGHMAATQDTEQLPKSLLEQLRAAASEESWATGSDMGTSLQSTPQVVGDVLGMAKALQEVMDDNKKLKEECKACKDAHSRDIVSLENMLAQVMAENKRLTNALEMHKAELCSQSKMMEGRVKNVAAGAKQRAMSPTPSSVPSTSLDTTVGSETSSDFRFNVCRDEAFGSLFAASGGMAIPYLGRR